MSLIFKGKGLYQLTGRNMPNNSLTSSPWAHTNLSTAQLQPITINGSGLSYNANVTSAGFSWSDLNVSLNPSVKKYEVVETTEDIVALAVTAQRVFKNEHIHYKLLDSSLFNKVTNEDRDHARTIKDYYSKKVMMMKLKTEKKLSPFREDMNKLIHTDGMTFKESMIGVAYWLPEFYEYDIKLDGIKTQFETSQGFDGLNKSGTPGTLHLSADLHPVECMQRRTKRSKNHEYWFKDSKLNAGVVIKIEDKNPLKHVWDYVFNSEKKVSIKGHYTRQTLDNFEYFSVTNWELQKG